MDVPAPLMDRGSFLAPFGEDFIASLDGVGGIVYNGAMLPGPTDDWARAASEPAPRKPLGAIQRYRGPQRWALGFGGVIDAQSVALAVQSTHEIFKPELIKWADPAVEALEVGNAIVNGQRRAYKIPVGHTQAEVPFEAVTVCELIGLHVNNRAKHPVEFRFLLIGLVA